MRSFPLLIIVVGLALMVVGNAIQPVNSWTSGPQQKYTPTATPLVTEGGNVTEVNITQNISTEKWAAIWGNITGNIVLGTQTNVFYSWTWSPANGGTICAQPGSVGNFDFTAITAATGGEVDNAFSFPTTDVDSATNTLTNACSVTIGSTTYNSNAGVTASGFTTCAFKDAATPAKTDLSFCTTVAQGTTLFNSLTGDYALMIPTSPTLGATESYVLWLELK